MSTADTICKDLSSGDGDGDDDDVCEMIDMLQQLSSDDNKDSTSICANCGKEGNDVNNTCNKCNQVKYCNAICKKKHRHKHKKDCEEYVRIVAEHAAKLHDKKLFKQPPPAEDCPICFLRLPYLVTGWRYKTCCGKVICSGCSNAPLYDNQGNEVDKRNCAFCRTPWPKSDEEEIQRLKKRMGAGDSIAIHSIGSYYRDGKYGLQQDYKKALEFWYRAVDLGYNEAYCNIAYSYQYGRGVEVDKKKAMYYYELAAMGGDVQARHNVGELEKVAGNTNRAIKHYMIAVGSGHSISLQTIQRLYSNGHATKEDYTKALQLHQAYLGEIKSAQRDKAAATYEDCRYY